MKFLVFYVLWPVVRSVAIAIGGAGLFLFAPVWLFGLQGAHRLMLTLMALCIVVLAAIFLLSAWDRYQSDRASPPKRKQSP